MALILSLVFISPHKAEASVKISKAKATMEVDSTLKLKVNGTNKEVKWSSSKKSVASVNKSGTVTAKKEGQATITATVGSKKYTCDVKVVDSNKPITQEATYKIGDTWTVDGLWKLTFNSVTTTDERNRFSDSTPSQVVVLDYTYENLGYENDILDLYISSLDFTVIDENRNVADTYPAGTNKSPRPTPVGARCVGAQEAFGLKDKSKKINVHVKMHGNGNYEDIYKAIFELDVD